MTGGVYPAMVTPMLANGEMDPPSAVRLTHWFRSRGCQGVVLAGTNGEGPSLAAVEKRDLVRTVCSAADGFPVVIGIATPSITEAAWLCEQSRKAGAAAALVMAPAYFREAPLDAVAEWFEALFAATELPCIVYNFPQRTGYTFDGEFLARLAKHERMIGVKDSSGNAANLAPYRQACSGALFVGDETLLLDALDAGWQGTISGAANQVTLELSEIVRQYPEESARVHFDLVRPRIEAIRSVPQPMAHKRWMTAPGILDSDAVRLPLRQPN